MIYIDNKDKKRRIDYDIEEILAEFADDDKGISSLADKYKAKIKNVPPPKKEINPKRPLQKKENQEILPGGHKVVYEDTSFNKEPKSPLKNQEKINQKTNQSQDNSRVVYDADLEIKENIINENDFKSFDDIPPSKAEDKPKGHKGSLPNRNKSKKNNRNKKKDSYKSSLNNARKSNAQENDDFRAFGEDFSLDLDQTQNIGEFPVIDADGFQSFGDAELFDSYANNEDLSGTYTGKEEEQSRIANIIYSFIPKKGDDRGEAIRKLIMTSALIVMLGVGIYLIAHFLDVEPDIPPPIDETSTDADGNYIDPRLEYPDIEFPEGLADRFVHYYAINPDFVGQIIVRGKNREVEYPVVQEKDKPEGAEDFYLKHSFFKEPTRYGTPFLDFRNDADAKDKNTILHGHNMMDGSQFAVIEDYVNDVENFKKNPIITYWTRYEEIHYKVYAVMITNGRAKDDNGYVFAYHTPKFQNEESFMGYKRMLDMRKLYTTGVDLNYDDQLITLSTCGYVFNDAWYVLVGRRLREDESLEIDESKIEINQNPWYPQAWYDSKGKKNPYINEKKWEG